jgi:hypothetical protein
MYEYAFKEYVTFLKYVSVKCKTKILGAVGKFLLAVGFMACEI